MPTIDNSSAIAAINTIKNYVLACFTKCTAKGSTYSGAQILSNLEAAIDAIPTGSGGGGGGVVSDNITGGAFSGFTVTSPDEPFAEEFTIEFGSIGVTWKSIICYSDTKDGHFTINKMPNNKCVISSASFYDASNQWEEASGIFPQSRGTYRATYSISGNSITFTNDEYEATSNGWDSYDDFSGMTYQVSNFVNDYFTDQYKLDKITVCV